ncbi:MULTISPECIES: hypothetical protein [unclassified Bacillus (in: firmicutes)]
MITDLDFILPHGDILKPFLSSSEITDSDLKKMLAKKGIYVPDSNPHKTIPLLCCNVLSPSEFQFLKENQKRKEDSIKRRSRSIDLKNDINFPQEVSSLDFDFDRLLNYDNNICRIKDSPQFNFENTNTASLSYTIEREDVTKNFMEHKTTHDAKITLVKNEDNQVDIIAEHTSTETKRINELIIKEAIKQFKDKGCVQKDTALKKLTSNILPTEDRNKFLFRLLNSDLVDNFNFNQVSNIRLGPNSDYNNPPQQIKWMEEKVKKVVLNGEAIDRSEIFTDPECLKAIIIEEIEASFNARFRSHEISCKVTFGFTNLLKNIESNNAEFEFKITPKIGFMSLNKNAVSQFLYESFDYIKNKVLSEFIQL